MYQFFTIMVVVLFLSCSEKISNSVDLGNNYHFIAQNNNKGLDHEASSVVKAYQDLLKGLNNKDTSYLYVISNQMLQLTDSLSNVKLPLDSNLNKIWVDGLNNLNAELQGLQFSVGLSDWEEAKMATHMCSLQIISLLSQIGYQEHPIYIYKSKPENAEDGFIWVDLQKTSRDPYHPKNHSLLSAVEVLQEIK